MQFRLVIPRHNFQSKSYRDKVDILRAGTVGPDHLLDLDRVDLLSRVRTEVPTGVQTPASQPATAVTVREKLGQGSFAVVFRVWNVSSGEQHALKTSLKTSFNAAAWDREALIMDRIKHVSPDKSSHSFLSYAAPPFHDINLPIQLLFHQGARPPSILKTRSTHIKAGKPLCKSKVETLQLAGAPEHCEFNYSWAFRRRLSSWVHTICTSIPCVRCFGKVFR